MKVLLIDANSICHRAKHKFGKLTYKGKNTGVIFGFFHELLFLLNKFHPDVLACCWDGSSSIREDIYPQYKEKRKNKKLSLSTEEKASNNMFHGQFEMLRANIFPNIRWTNNFVFNGYEGDDLMASIINNNKDEFVIVSSDEDLYQLLSDRVSLYDLGKKRVYTNVDFQTEYGINPLQWANVKSIAGCTSDEVAGIQGVGVKTAIKFLHNELKPSTKVFDGITSDQGREIIRRNLSLVQLPLKGTPRIKLSHKQKIRIDKLTDCFNYYGMFSMIKKEDEWKKLLARKAGGPKNG
jgi:DNA polymerase-1